MKLYYMLLVIAFSIQGLALAKRVDYPEDVYSYNVSGDLETKLDAAARLVGFEGDYQAVILKEAGLAMNPAGLITVALFDSVHQKPLWIVNPLWLDQLPLAEQQIPMVSFFIRAQTGFSSWAMTIAPWLFALLGFFTMVGLFLIVTKTRWFIRRPQWQRMAAMFLGLMVINSLIFSPVQNKINKYLSFRYQADVFTKVVEKTGDRAATISYLHAFDDAVKQLVQEGNSYMKPCIGQGCTIAHQLAHQ